MNTRDVTQDDVAAYMLGDISDQDELDRIERAVVADAQVAAWYHQVQERLTPSPATRQSISRMFQALDESVWARVLWSADADPEPGVRRATLELPEIGAVKVQFRETDDGVRMDLADVSVLDAWQAASLVTFIPRVAAGTPLESRPTAAGRQSGDCTAILGAHTERSSYVVSAHTADDGGGITWKSSTVSNLEGSEAYLENTPNGVSLVVNMPIEAAPLRRASYEMRWRSAEAEEQTRHGIVSLNRDDGIRYMGRAHLRLPFSELAGSRDVELVVKPLGPREAPSLTADELRAAAGDNYQTMPLSAATDAGNSDRTARLRTDVQRRLWSDPSACQMIRFEPQS